MVMRKVGKYEVGRTIGEGTFAKVKFAQNSETGESVAMKILDKEAVLKHKMVDQIKREISVMKLVRHPYVVRLHEVLASRSKIYIILEFVTGGELFDKIVHQGRLSENEARRYFHQLIDAVDYCHSKGVCHRDLKPENLLLDSQGNLKISDFGLSALPQQTRADGLLHTTCGTPNYVAPEVLGSRGYAGSVADVWSCGVILFVLMAGFLPFDEPDLATLYRKVNTAEYTCPTWFSPGAKSLIYKILEPDPQMRITISGIRNDDWFKKNYTPVRLYDDEDINLEDIQAVFDDSEVSDEQTFAPNYSVNDSILEKLPNFDAHCFKLQFMCCQDKYVNDQRGNDDSGPYTMNAFELITLSQGFNLSALFDRRQDHVKRQTRYISRYPAKEIMAKMEVAATNMGFNVQTRGYKMRLEGSWSERGAELAVAMEVFEVAPSLYLVEVRKAAGDTLDYHKFYKRLCSDLGDVVWK